MVIVLSVCLHFYTVINILLAKRLFISYNILNEPILQPRV